MNAEDLQLYQIRHIVRDELKRVQVVLDRQFRVGRFAITPDIRGGFWIEEDGGEGMQVSAAKLEQCLTEFWGANF